MNVTEAKHFYGSEEEDFARIFNEKKCINPPKCPEYAYN